MSAERELDVVLYGATGFVGVLTAEYLARAAPGGARIGLGARSRERLEALRARLGGPAADWPLIVADSSDAAAMADMARRTRAVATTVGPYAKYGRALAQACAEAGTHYADLCGEVLFIRETIDRVHAKAGETGARIVHACGFDSIPSELGVQMLHEAAGADGDGELEDTTFVVAAMRGSFSGGTLASLKVQLDEVRADRELRRFVEDPYALSPDRDAEPDLGRQRDLQGVVRDEELGLWLTPFVMASVNTRVVRRSNALQDWAYGRRFRYREVMGFGAGPLAPAKAAGVTAGLAALAGALAFGPTRAALDRVLPGTGEGPSEQARERGFFRMEIHAETASGARYLCRVGAQGDPGYAATAVMLGESALCLALDEERLPGRGGVLTPATAMGTALVDRLKAAGFTFEVERRGA
jgi:short subunit dehydrogenase-like uncharacterized protein